MLMHGTDEHVLWEDEIAAHWLQWEKTMVSLLLALCVHDQIRVHVIVKKSRECNESHVRMT